MFILSSISGDLEFRSVNLNQKVLKYLVDVDNCCQQYFSVLILLQYILNEVHFHHFYRELVYF